jgi:hypothetical protein
MRCRTGRNAAWPIGVTIGHVSGRVKDRKRYPKTGRGFGELLHIRREEEQGASENGGGMPKPLSGMI